MSSSVGLTIFTPTYNRAQLLPRLFKSIKNQTCRDFEWLIVDDGSADDTRSVVEDFKKSSCVNIRYIYQENSGKPTAFNNAVKNACGELFFCVDSDDMLAENAVELLLNEWKRGGEGICGILGLKADMCGNLLCGRIPSGLSVSSMYRLVGRYGCRGEFSLAFKTEILLKNPFPIVCGEKFITECVLYDSLDKKYEMLLLDRVLTICEYQSEGLSANPYAVQVKNPTGYKIYYAARIDMADSFSERLGYALRYSAFSSLAGTRLYGYCGKHRLLVNLLKPFGLFAGLYYTFRSKF